MDYADLKADLLAQIGRAPSSLCYTLVTADVNQTLRLHHMLKEEDLTSPYSLPSDFLEVQAVLVDDRVLSPAAEAVISRVANTNAGEFTVASDKLVLDVTEATIKLKYYGKVDDLAGDADTNTVLTNNPAVYVYGVLAHHAALTRDTDALATWKPIYENLMASTQREDNTRRMSETSMNIKARASA